jgi:hypothetical protein
MLLIIKQADLHTAAEYALGARRVKRNEKLQVATRAIACPWEEWAKRAIAIGAQREAQASARRNAYEEIERSRADRVLVKANRTLPEKYDEDYFYTETDASEREVLSKAYIPARRLGSYASPEAIKPLLVDLPVPALRDILEPARQRVCEAPYREAGGCTHSRSLSTDRSRVRAP